jgi:flagellar biosynthesis protein
MDKNNPKSIQQAVALAYEHGDFSPKVVASGRGIVAEQIIQAAIENQIYIHESKELESLLMQVDLDDYVPEEMYRAIAEILAWVYELEQRQ